MGRAKRATLMIAEELYQAVSKIDRPGTYCASGHVPLVLPGLEVNGLGPVGLPLSPIQAQELIGRCEQAPYGKGEATLVDPSVRRVWRLTPDKFSLTNPDWTVTVRGVVGLVQAELGLKDQKLEAHLYDLLLYEEGGFFLPHRDGEKLDRMVATLVLVLPSAFEGGELVVRHEGEQQVIDFCRDTRSVFQIHYAAFYADCEHEVKPLRKGHRLCLVYNLTLARAGSKQSLAAPRLGEHVARLGEILSEWSQATGDVPVKLALRLEHKYTPEGLAWDALKGADRAKARALAEAAAQSGCHAYLALLTLWESGSAESDYDYGYDRRGRHRYWDEEEDEDDDIEADTDEDDGNIEGKYTMSEVFDESLTAERLSSLDGESRPISTLQVEPNEFVPADALRAVKPEEDYEGYTGNAGMTLDRWYRHAVILLWPDKHHFDVLCSCGSRTAMTALLPLVAGLRRANKSDAAAMRTECIQFANRIIANWPENAHGGPIYDDRSRRIEEEDGLGADLLSSLITLEDASLATAYLNNVLARDASVDPGQSLGKACAAFGWMTFREPLEAVCSNSNEAMLPRNVRLLDRLCAAGPSTAKAGGGRLKAARAKAPRAQSNPERDQLCRHLATAVVSALEALDARKETYYYGNPLNRAVLLTELARALVSTNQHKLLSRVISHSLALPEKYPLITAHVAALSKLKQWLPQHVPQPCAPVSHWIAACIEQLAKRTVEEPQPPTDFRRPAVLECKCADCKMVNTFLADPSSSVHRLRARQQLRDHVDSEIRCRNCDLTTTTDRKGSPHTLVCTKNTASFEHRLKTYHEDCVHLALLQSLASSLPG